MMKKMISFDFNRARPCLTKSSLNFLDALSGDAVRGDRLGRDRSYGCDALAQRTPCLAVSRRSAQSASESSARTRAADRIPEQRTLRVAERSRQAIGRNAQSLELAKH